MTDIEAKVRCLELAASVSRIDGPDAIVKTATMFYNHIVGQVSKPSQDKPKR